MQSALPFIGVGVSYLYRVQVLAIGLNRCPRLLEQPVFWWPDAIQFLTDRRNCSLGIISKLKGCFVFFIVARELPCLGHAILEQLRWITFTEIKTMLSTAQVLIVTTRIEIIKAVLDSFETGRICVRKEGHIMHPV